MSLQSQDKHTEERRALVVLLAAIGLFPLVFLLIVWLIPGTWYNWLQIVFGFVVALVTAAALTTVGLQRSVKQEVQEAEQVQSNANTNAQNVSEAPQSTERTRAAKARDRSLTSRTSSSNRSQRDRKLASEDQHMQQAKVQAYLDQMGQWLIEKNLRRASADDEILMVARARTVTLLSELDPHNRSTVLRFLYESRLLEAKQPVVRLGAGANLEEVDFASSRLRSINLSGAKLSGARFDEAEMSEANLKDTLLNNADLRGANLKKANLDRADLSGADLSRANLEEANLSEANLQNAKLDSVSLKEAVLENVDLRGADLSAAKGVTNEEVEAQAKSLKGATMPDGSKHS